VCLYVSTSLLTFALLITVLRLICYTKLTALATITVMLIISNISFLCWFKLYTLNIENWPWLDVTSWFFTSTPVILSFWIISQLYWYLSLKMKLVSEGKQPNEYNRLSKTMYYGGITAILVLEVVEAVTYALTNYPHTLSNIFYYILVFFQLVCIGFLGDSLRRITSVIKEYHLMTID
jgi:hypothetical protein